MESSGTADLIRKESGNERYAYFFPVDDPEAVLLIDIWRDQELLDLRHATPMMAMIAQLRGKYDLHTRVERYVTDPGGVPSTGAQFIRS